jgi:phosphatidate cytidylyltransferase
VVFTGVLIAATLAGQVLQWRSSSEHQHLLVRDFNQRTLGWWPLVAVFMPAVLAGGAVVLIVFAATSLITWFEFTGVSRRTALRPRDLIWAMPLVALRGAALVGWTTISVWQSCVVALVVIAIVDAAADPVPSASRIAWRTTGYFTCVFALGTAPALALRFGNGWLCYTLVIVQVGDVLQYICGKAFGRHLLAPRLSPKKTWEGLIGGVLASACLGAALSSWIARNRIEGFRWGLEIAIAGTASGFAMSAVKRHHGAKDFGTWLPGHGGLLDRVDSLCGAVVAVYISLAW